MLKSFLVIASLVVPQWAYSNPTSQAVAPTIQGRDVVPFLAATCSPETWNQFTKWNKLKWFLDAKFANKEKPDIQGNKITFKSEKITYQVETNGAITVSSDGSVVKARDLCDLFLVSDKAPEKKSAFEIFQILPAAYALDPVREAKLIETHARATGYVAVAALTAGAILTPCTAFCWASAIGVLALNKNGLEYSDELLAQKEDFENAINMVVEVKSCSADQITIEAYRAKVVANKIKDNWELTMVKPINKKSMNEESRTQGSKHLVKSRAFIAELSKRCKTNADAAQITSEIAQYRRENRERIATLETVRAIKPAGTNSSVK